MDAFKISQGEVEKLLISSTVFSGLCNKAMEVSALTRDEQIARELKQMSKKIFVLNGPNLNLLGKRQPEIYGSKTLEDVKALCEETAESLGLDIVFHQSNAEHALVDWIQEAREAAEGIVINPAAYSHTSVAILDALNMCDFPVIEVHISNIHKREEFRHHSFVSGRADAVIAGCGVEGYQLALMRMATLLQG